MEELIVPSTTNIVHTLIIETIRMMLLDISAINGGFTGYLIINTNL